LKNQCCPQALPVMHNAVSVNI